MRISETFYKPVSATSDKILLLLVAATNAAAVIIHFQTGRLVGAYPWYGAAFAALASAYGFHRVSTRPGIHSDRFFFGVYVLLYLKDLQALFPKLPGVGALMGLTGVLLFAIALRLAQEVRRERARERYAVPK